MDESIRTTHEEMKSIMAYIVMFSENSTNGGVHCQLGLNGWTTKQRGCFKYRRLKSVRSSGWRLRGGVFEPVLSL